MFPANSQSTLNDYVDLTDSAGEVESMRGTIIADRQAVTVVYDSGQSHPLVIPAGVSWGSNRSSTCNFLSLVFKTVYGSSPPQELIHVAHRHFADKWEPLNGWDLTRLDLDSFLVPYTHLVPDWFA